jgi:hypothetical protein
MIRGISKIPCPFLPLLALALTAAVHGASEVPNLSLEEDRLLAKMAAEGTNAATLYALADHCHDRGIDGDKKAVVRAEEYLRDLLAIQPTNAPALALLGSVYTMKGRDAFWPTAQLRYVREGNGYLDQAVRLAPDDPQTRLIRALNNAHMPDFLGRTDIARGDLEWLWARMQTEPGGFTLSARQNVGWHWGRQLKRQRRVEEARRVWESAQALNPDTKAGRLIAAELAKLR